MTDQHPTAEGLMRGILADPSDPLPRLVFADWLDDTGIPHNAAWAKYLRLAVDLVHLPLTAPRRLYLQSELDRVSTELVAELTYKAEQFIQYADSIRQLLPLERLTLKLDTVSVPQAVIDFVPHAVALEHSALPLTLADDCLTVALANPADTCVTESLERAVGRRVRAVRASAESLPEAIERHYADRGAEPLNFTAFVANLESSERADEPLRREAESGPVVRFISMMLADAIAQAAEEVTLERHGPRVEVRFLHAGERKLWGGLSERNHLPLVARIQLLAGLNLGRVECEQIGSLPHVAKGRLYYLGLRVQPARQGPRAILSVPKVAPADETSGTDEGPAAA